MGDSIKRLFHKRYRSDPEGTKPLQSFPYSDSQAGPPPRKGSLPLRGNNTVPINGALSTAALSANPTRAQRSASLGSVPGARRAASNASRRGRPGDLLRSNLADITDIPPASPPLPGTALTSDDARYWRDVDGNGNPLVRQLSAGAESRYGEEVADRVLAEYFPKPPSHDQASDASASLSTPSQTGGTQARGSYTLPDSDGFPSLGPVRSSNTQSRLFLEDSDEENDHAGSREQEHRASPSSLKRKKGHSSGLRNFSNPRNDYSVQEPAGKHYKPDGHTNAGERSYLIEDSPEPPSLDLRNTEDITYHSRYAPAVTHQTVHREISHIREEQIFREVHTHDVFNRILPVIDIEVRPARHFVPGENGCLREIPEEEVPGRASEGQARNWLVAELVSRRKRHDETPIEPRQFSSRQFAGTEGDEKRYVTQEGFERTETTWVHPPTINSGAKEAAQTCMLPFRPRTLRDESCEVEVDAPNTQMSLRDLAGDVRDCPFDECAEFEARGWGTGRGSSEGQSVGINSA